MSPRYRTWFSAACLTLALAGYTQLSSLVHSSESSAAFPIATSQFSQSSHGSSHASKVASVPLSENSIASTSVNSAYLEQTVKLLTLLQGWIKDGSQ